MRSVLAELDALIGAGSAAPGTSGTSAAPGAPAEELTAERHNTVEQLDRMLTIGAEQGDAID